MPFMLNAAHVDIAFAQGELATADGTLNFAVHPIGELLITSGNIAASDPLVSPQPTGYSQPVPCGRHPVSLAVARFANGDERVAYARVQFADAPAVQWKMATVGTQDISTLGPNEFFGYGVDAGTGCFMDTTTGALLEARMDEDDDYFETIIEAMDETYQHTRSWASIRPDPAREENLVCFSSGWGDGSYASYFGYDAQGKVVALLTDFMVFSEPEQPEA